MKTDEREASGCKDGVERGAGRVGGSFKKFLRVSVSPGSGTGSGSRS